MQKASSENLINQKTLIKENHRGFFLSVSLHSETKNPQLFTAAGFLLIQIA